MEDKILEFIKIKGPVIPLDISKAFNLPLLFASAYLSDLRSQGKLQITNLKFDGTPFYYLKGQEEKLVGLAKYLREKDKEIFELLKKRKVLKDSELEPLQRVSLRNLKDFAYLFEFDNEIFWRFFLVSESEAREIAKEDKKEEIKEQEKKVKIEKREETKKLKEEKIRTRRTIRKGLLSEEKLKEILNEKNIEIEEIKIIRKDKDYELKIIVPSPIGNVRFFCKIKDKKNVNDADLSQAYLKAELEKLPLYFITTGGLSKKARELSKNLKNVKIQELRWV